MDAKISLISATPMQHNKFPKLAFDTSSSASHRCLTLVCASPLAICRDISSFAELPFVEQNLRHLDRTSEQDISGMMILEERKERTISAHAWSHSRHKRNSIPFSKSDKISQKRKRISKGRNPSYWNLRTGRGVEHRRRDRE
jgi:hypothetical protein